MTMQGWQQRVIAEHQELVSKLSQLQALTVSPEFYERVPETQDRALLIEQRQYMTSYAAVLAQRISRFEK